MKAPSYIPSIAGTIRGPYRRDDGSTQFLVQGKGGWVPFNSTEESQAREQAEGYAAKIKPPAATRYTAAELETFGYSKTDATRMVSEGRNWKATRGGKRP